MLVEGHAIFRFSLACGRLCIQYFVSDPVGFLGFCDPVGECHIGLLVAASLNDIAPGPPVSTFRTLWASVSKPEKEGQRHDKLSACDLYQCRLETGKIGGNRKSQALGVVVLAARWRAATWMQPSNKEIARGA